MESIFKGIKSVHFVGIGGISMSSLAKYCLCSGVKVTGSDRCDSEIIDELRSLGAVIGIPSFELKKIRCDLMVYSSAIAEDNIELAFARERKIKLLKRSEFLEMVTSEFDKTVCVSGCHGKTTVTAMISHIFMQGKYIPTVFIGGMDRQYKNFFFGGKEVAVYEGCEYKKNFLDLSPQTVVITNIDLDHPDSYIDLQDTVDSFYKFTRGKNTVINADDVNSKSLIESADITYGINNGRVTAKNITETEDGSVFDVYLSDEKIFTAKIHIFGKFNIYNALASISCALLYGIDYDTIACALNEFRGVGRRQERIGKLFSVPTYCDYAHHPREIGETLSALGERKTLAVFQPHTYSRTKALMSEFIESLSATEEVVIYKTFPSREDFDKDGDAKTLYKKLKKTRSKVYYCENEERLKKLLVKKADRKSRIIFFGAGDIYDIANRIIKNIR